LWLLTKNTVYSSVRWCLHRLPGKSMLSCHWHVTLSHHGKEIHMHMWGKITREFLAKYVAFNHSSLSVTLCFKRNLRYILKYKSSWSFNKNTSRIDLRIPNFQNFPGGHVPRPPSNSMLRMLFVLCTTLINLLKQPLHILIVWLDHLKIASYAPKLPASSSCLGTLYDPYF